MRPNRQPVNSTSTTPLHSPQRSSARWALVCVALAGLLQGCMVVRPPGVLFATEPPGANVVINGRDSGFATPIELDLDRGKMHTVEFKLDGYDTAVRHLDPSLRVHVVPWYDGDLGPKIWRFPLYLTFFGLIAPVRINNGLVPGRIYVPLRVATED